MRHGVYISRGAAISFIIYIVLALGGIYDSVILHVIGMAGLFVLLLVSNVNEAILLTVIFTPNLAVLTFKNDGMGLIGIVYSLLFLKILVRYHSKLKIKKAIILPFIYLICISFLRMFSGNVYDLFIITEVLIILLTWDFIFDECSANLFNQIYDAYGYGCTLLLLGMILNLANSRTSILRMTAILDDANFCSMAFLILFACSLIAFSYKLFVRNSILFIIVSLIGGAATGSRGFLAAFAVVIALFMIVGLLSSKARKAVLFIALFIGIVVLLYILRIGVIVQIYDNTIGRTLQLRSTYESGKFMDISSGRFFLWNYYLDFIFSNNHILLWGRGFQNYYLAQNGGYYGMSAHNSYIASVIGVGILGSILLLLSYISLWKKRLSVPNKQKFAFLSIAIGTACGYFFLDGILDTRLIMSIVMTVVMCQIYISQYNAQMTELLG